MDLQIEPEGKQNGRVPADDWRPGAADAVQALRRRLWIERGFFLAILLAVLYAWFSPVLFPKVWAVWVDGQPVVAMRNRATLQAIASEFGVQQAGDSKKAPSIRVRPVRPDRAPITDAETAREKLALAWAELMPRGIIYIDGVSAVALPDRAQAQEVLERVKAHYSEGLTQLSSVPGFKETVEVREEAAPADLLADADTAAALLLGESGEKKHTVAPGETGWTIARKYSLSLTNLKRLNPSMNLDRLKVGQGLRVAEDAEPAVTVIAEGEMTQEVPLAPPSEIRTSAQMYLGKRLVLQPGVPGKERVTMRVRSENGVIVEKEVLARQKIAAPKSKVVVLGIKPRPTPRRPGRG